MRDAARFTVDDPRFSTAQVVRVQHAFARRRRASSPPGPVREGVPGARGTEPLRRLGRRAGSESRGGVARRRPCRDPARPGGPARGRRRDAALGLLDSDPAMVLGWYDEIVAGVDRISAAVRQVRRRAWRCPLSTGTCERPSRAAPDEGVLSAATATLDPGEVVVERGGDDVRWHRDQRRHDDDAVLAPPQLARPAREGARRPDAPRRRHRGIPCASSRPPGPVVSLRNGRHRAGRARSRPGDSRHRVADRGQPRPRHVRRPRHFDVARPERPSPCRVRPGRHACVGPHLARLEAGAAIGAALDPGRT